MAFGEILLAEYSGQSRAGKMAPSCPLGYPITAHDFVCLARSRSQPYNKVYIQLPHTMSLNYSTTFMALEESSQLGNFWHVRISIFFQSENMHFLHICPYLAKLESEQVCFICFIFSTSISIPESSNADQGIFFTMQSILLTVHHSVIGHIVFSDVS